MAEKKKSLRGPKGKAIKISTKEKEKPLNEQPSVDERGYVESEELYKWVIRRYPENQPVDRKSGRVINLDGKKVIKAPTFENKGGYFFGAHLNTELDKVFVSNTLCGLHYHRKSNVWKIREKISLDLFNKIKEIIENTHKPKIEIG